MSSAVSFITRVQVFAANPLKEVGRFKLIDPTQENSYSLKLPYFLTGIGLAAISLIFFKKSKLVFGGFAFASSAVLYKSVDVKKVDTKPYSDQTGEINVCFDFYINGFKEQFQAKANAIRKAVNGLELSSFDDVKATIEIVADIYDRTTKPVTWTVREVPTNEMDEPTYNALKVTARSLIAFDLKTLGELDPTVQKKMTTLQQTARIFLDGVKINGEKGQDAYVGYNWAEGRATIKISLL